MSSHVWERLRPHWPFTLVAILGLALVLSNLGKDYLWADEGDTAVLAANIIKGGVPKAWDGVTFLDSDKGARLNHNLVMVTSPWLQYMLPVLPSSFLENTHFRRDYPSRLPSGSLSWSHIASFCKVLPAIGPGFARPQYSSVPSSFFSIAANAAITR